MNAVEKPKVGHQVWDYVGLPVWGWSQRRDMGDQSLHLLLQVYVTCLRASLDETLLAYEDPA